MQVLKKRLLDLEQHNFCIILLPKMQNALLSGNCQLHIVFSGCCINMNNLYNPFCKKLRIRANAGSLLKLRVLSTQSSYKFL